MTFLRQSALGLVGIVAMVAGCDPEQPAVRGEEPTAATTTQALTQTTPFDWDNGNVAADIIIPACIPLITTLVHYDDATLLFHITATATATWFDAAAPFTAKTVGFYSKIPNLPPAKRTNRNANIAIAYANYRALLLVMPTKKTEVRAIMTGLGLDPDDNSTNLTTPVGIGNYAGNKVVAARVHDGMNILGDAGGKKYWRRPYEDTTGYQPFNTPYDLKDPSRWQPDILTTGHGIFTVQQHVTPQISVADPFIVKNVRDVLTFPPPVNSDWQHRSSQYRAQADTMLTASASLNDEKKMKAEYFNMKLLALGGASIFAGAIHGMSVIDFALYDHTVVAAAFDAATAVWKAKLKYDAVRPVTAIHFLKKGQKVRAWGGVGQGTVNDMPGEDWRPYLQTSDHSEYPSASTCFCAAHAEASRRWFGSDSFGLSWSFPRGSSDIEPGITPANDMTFSWPTYTDFANQCGQSRVDAGVHFPSAVQASLDNCGRAGAAAYQVVMRHINGQADNDNCDDDDDDQGHGHGH